MIENEVGEDVYSKDNPNCKLLLFEKWLYGTSSPIQPRLAPSIIARSEAELLGISSPRFAIRVYFGNFSFANIRRRKLTARQIRRTYPENIADHLQGISFKRLEISSSSDTPEVKTRKMRVEQEKAVRAVNWIADCLLEPPPRLLQEGFKILTCSLGVDYGEDQIQAATPFVTHISIGGGLCAQAACFMALCLLENTEIFSISEITCLAASDPGEFEIHGLKPRTIVDFLTSSAHLGAQLQCVSNSQDKTAIAKDLEKIQCALRNYIHNRLPVLQMLSASRMQGLRPGDRKPSIPNPIITSSGNTVDPDSNSLPLGRPLTYFDSYVSARGDTDHDNHCVVIVGCNEDASCFLLNDPATMPFVKATVEQLYEARSYRSFERDDSIQDPRFIGKEIEWIDEGDLGWFQFIAVVPKGVEVWLLHLVGQKPQRGGLLNAIQPSLTTGVMGIRYPASAGAFQNLKLHLGQWTGNGMEFRSGLMLDANAHACLVENAPVVGRWYWVSEINTPDKTGQFVESFSVWDASFPGQPGSQHTFALKDLLYLVIAQRSDGRWQRTYRREQ